MVQVLSSAAIQNRSTLYERKIELKVSLTKKNYLKLNSRLNLNAIVIVTRLQPVA